MRTSCLMLCAALATAADAPPATAPPPAVQKLIDASTEAVQKAHEAYVQAAHKEQDKLVAALQKEEDKATKRGDLDAALAIKAQIDDVQAGLLQREAEAGKDLLGGPAAAASGVPAALSTDCPLQPDTTAVANPPKDYEPVLGHSSHIAIPKGDHTRYVFTCVGAGTVLVSTGGYQRNFAEVWAELQKAGFKRVDDPATREAWWALEAKPGLRFAAFDAPMGVVPVTVYAGRFARAH